MNKRKKKALLTLLMVAVLGVVGGTFAYFMSEDTFTNVFSTKPYKMEVKETFQSPTDWTPGTTTSKTVIAKNTGQVDAAVRVSIESQAWQDSLGQPLNLAVNGEDAAIINYADDLAEKWTSSVEGGKTYYYYKTNDENSIRFNKIKKIELLISGKDLLNIGYCQGKQIGTILNKLLSEKLKSPKSYTSTEHELNWIKENFPLC